MQCYKHVIVIGVDGAGAFIREADTPHFDRIFADGAVTHSALSSKPTISAECWGSMLLGVGPEVHKLTNAIVSSTPYPTDSPFPSLFRRIREAMPDAALGSYCDWNPISFGIVENTLNVTKATARDTNLAPMICDCIREKKPTFLFTQFDSVDGAGHAHGYGSKEHLHRIHEVDELMSSIYETVREAGILDDTLFLLISDHGGTPFNGVNAHHGGWSEAERLVTFTAIGKTVQKCSIHEMNIRDLAAIVLYALGIEAPSFDEEGWTAQVPEGIFCDSALPKYRDITHLSGDAPRQSNRPHTSELV